MESPSPRTDVMHEEGRFKTFRGVELSIYREQGTGYFKVRQNRGPLHPRLKGRWKSTKDAERALISFLKSKDRLFSKNTYPGSDSTAPLFSE